MKGIFLVGLALDGGVFHTSRPSGIRLVTGLIDQLGLQLRPTNPNALFGIGISGHELTAASVIWNSAPAQGAPPFSYDQPVYTCCHHVTVVFGMAYMEALLVVRLGCLDDHAHFAEVIVRITGEARHLRHFTALPFPRHRLVGKV